MSPKQKDSSEKALGHSMSPYPTLREANILVSKAAAEENVFLDFVTFDVVMTDEEFLKCHCNLDVRRLRNEDR